MGNITEIAQSHDRNQINKVSVDLHAPGGAGKVAVDWVSYVCVGQSHVWRSGV